MDATEVDQKLESLEKLTSERQQAMQQDISDIKQQLKNLPEEIVKRIDSSTDTKISLQIEKQKSENIISLNKIIQDNQTALLNLSENMSKNIEKTNKEIQQTNINLEKANTARESDKSRFYKWIAGLGISLIVELAMLIVNWLKT